MPQTPQPADQSAPALVIVRHGQTEWSLTGRHTGRTDVALTDIGEQQARAAGSLVRQVLAGIEPALVISSPRQRACQTAALAGYLPGLVTEDAAEWDYGELEGLTGAEIGQRFPGWSIWTGPVPGGEDSAAITERIDRLLARAAQAGGPVLVFSHGHASRCLTARWLAEPVTGGRHFRLDTGAVCTLGYEHGRHVVLQWNLDKTVSGVSG